MVKKGDTLIEVTLAIGIFSMIAIAVSAVMSGGTAGAQLSLETTLAREEIDTQAEALRFIHSAYVNNKNNADHPYTALWRHIVENAIDIRTFTGDKLTEILQYNPASCSDLYKSSAPGLSNAFVINPRELVSVSSDVGYTTGFKPDSALITYKGSSTKFGEASTYPRLIYGNNINDDKTAALADDSFPSNLFRAEGIYVIAVKDPASTDLVDIVDDKVDKASAYYDFYIRTCWYGSGADGPSSISTVIRLHDPDSTFSGGPFNISFSGFDKNYSAANQAINNRTNIRKIKLPEPERYGWIFNGWCSNNVEDDGTCSSTKYPAGTELFNNDPSTHPIFSLDAIWTHADYKINFNLDGGSATSISNLVCYQDTTPNNGCQIPTEVPTKSGYKFKGWCSGNVVNEVCSGVTYQPGHVFPNANFPNLFPSNRTINLRPIWHTQNETYKITLTWGSSPRDLDSHVVGQKSNNTYFHAYYSTKVGSDINGLTIAELDRDVTSGYGPETFILNTLGGKDYYYYVYCFSGCSKITGATVTLDIKNAAGGWDLVNTFYSNNATGSGRYWNVFAYKNGQLVTRQTHSDSEQTNY